MKTLLLSTVILVHSWYPSNCCSDKDCKPVPCETIQHQGNVYKYTDPADGKRYDFAEERHDLSPDGQCHVCIWTGSPMCIFTPYPIGS